MPEERQQGQRHADTPTKPACETPRRADYQLHPAEVSNGNRRPVEVHQFSEVMRHWREQSAQSKLLVS